MLIINGWGGTGTAVTSDIGATHTGRLFANSNNGAPNPGNWNATSGVLNQIQVNAAVAAKSLRE